MNISFLIIFSILGIIIGSFLNVVILRFNTQKSLGGRSGCMVCQRTLLWYELIPVLSFFLLKGRCGSCKTKISIQYPLVEICTGVIFAGLFWKFQNMLYIDPTIFAFSYIYYCFIFSLLLVITVYDIRHKIIPNYLVLIFGVLSFIGMFLFYNNISLGFFHPHLPTLMDFFGSFVVAVPFALIWFLSKGRWMGFGDAKLALGLGFLLGLSSVLSATVLAFWSGAIVGLLLLVLNKIKKQSSKVNLKTEIPFAPFLVLGTFLVFIFGFNFFPYI